MGWTVNQGRRRDRLRRRPHLEHLDDRCLLSTGLEGHLIAAPTLREHATGAIRTGHHDATQGKGGELVVRHHGRAHANRERPAGIMTSTTSAGAPYDSIIGASQVQSNYNVNGSGMTVAVIDTGVDYNNPALGSGYGPGAKVIAGYDFADNSTNPMAAYSQHGTAVAGIIGSDSASDPGVAPGVNIVALRVTDSTNTASLTSIANALQWVITNHAQYNITVVNLSLSDGNNYAHNWFATTGGEAEQVTNLIGQLRGMNIPVVVATGNNFTGAQGEGFAAIVQGTISVTATDLSGNLLPDAQRLGTSIGGSSATVIAAPGEGFTAPSGDSGSSSVDGTSFATPLVSGAVVLLQQIYEQRFGTLPTVDQIQSWLQGGSDPIYDPVTGITIGELDIPKAAALIPSAASTVTPPPSITSTLQVSTASAAPTPSSTSSTSITTQTTTTAPAAPAAPAVTTTAVSSPTPTPPPTSNPAPAQATSNQQVISEAGDQSDESGNGSSGSAPPAVSGLALLLQSMKVWAASSSRG
jgi:subtilisin family serine protease